MNDDDLRDVAAVLRGVTGATAEECYRFADEMLEARKKRFWVEPEEDGIASVAKRPYKRRVK